MTDRITAYLGNTTLTAASDTSLSRTTPQKLITWENAAGPANITGAVPVAYAGRNGFVVELDSTITDPTTGQNLVSWAENELTEGNWDIEARLSLGGVVSGVRWVEYIVTSLYVPPTGEPVVTAPGTVTLSGTGPVTATFAAPTYTGTEPITVTLAATLAGASLSVSGGTATIARTAVAQTVAAVWTLTGVVGDPLVTAPVTVTVPAYTVPASMVAPVPVVLSATAIRFPRPAAPFDGGTAILSYRFYHTLNGTPQAVQNDVGAQVDLTGLMAGDVVVGEFRAVNAAGESLPGATATAQTWQLPAQMSAPTLVDASDAATLQWPAAPNLFGRDLVDDGYFYEVTLASDPTFAAVVASGRQSTLANTNVSPLGAGSYIARVWAVTDAGAGVKSVASAAVTVTATVPAVGEAGAVGTLFEGYVLGHTTDFAALDVWSPSNADGLDTTVRTMRWEPRSSNQLGGTNTDPAFTGYQDSNDGVPVGFDNMRIVDGAAVLTSRRDGAGESVHLVPGKASIISALISSARRVLFHPGAAGTADILVQFRARMSPGAGNPAGWHPTLWGQSWEPTRNLEADEWDYEGNSQRGTLRQARWTGGTYGSVYSGQGNPYAHDGDWHDFTFRLNKSTVTLYIDGVQHDNSNRTANDVDEAQYWIASNHVATFVFDGESFSQSAWDNSETGAEMSVDYVRVWQRPATPRRVPLVTVPNAQVAYGGSVTLNVPTAETLWGAGATDYVQAIWHDYDTPGLEAGDVFTRFPSIVTWDFAARTLTINPTTGRPGRLFFASGSTVDGAVCEPALWHVDIGPNITTTEINTAVGDVLTVDMGDRVDFGNLVSNGTARTSVVAVTNLPAWASYNSTTRVLSGTPDVEATTAITITATNSAGQVATESVNLNAVAAGAIPAFWSFEDNFNRANELLSVSPNWTWDNAAGNEAGKVNNNEMATTAIIGNHFYLCPDRASADNWTSAKMANNSNRTRIISRYLDVNNFMGADFDGTNVVVNSVVANTFTTLATVAATGTPVVVLSCIGAVWTLYVDGTEEATGAIPAELQGAGLTRQGVRVVGAGGGNTPVMDDFRATAG